MEITDLTTEPTTDATAQEKPRFAVTDEGSANWVLKKLAENRSELKRIKDNAATREQELQADYNSLLGRYGAELEAFAREEAERRRRKTVTLEQGSLAFRAVAPKLVIDDTETARTTARAVCPDAFTTETVEKFDADAFITKAKETLESTGEILPGLKMTEASEAFSIRVSKE